MSSVRVRIFPILMVLFLVIPIIEIYLLIQVGGYIGVLPTIALVVLTAVMGASLLKSQGTQTYLRFNQSLSEGRVPANEILEGVALLIGGALLLTPGFFTDSIGFLCLLPFTRRPLATFIVNRFNPMSGPMSGMSMGGFGQISPGSSSGPSQSNGSGHNPSNKPNNKQGSIIEGEVTHRSDD
jgi:UPF0716 protein FxsA